eukprot:1048345-Rhodomonas_salina.1
MDAMLTELKPHNRVLLASLFQLRASSSEDPPESPRLTGRMPKEILIGLLNGLQILEPVDKDAEVRWSSTSGQKRPGVEQERSQGSGATASGSEEFIAPLTLSWVQNWLRKRRMLTYKPEWRVSGQSLDSLSWEDFKNLFRVIARKLLGSAHEEDDDRDKARRKQGALPANSVSNTSILAGGVRADPKRGDAVGPGHLDRNNTSASSKTLLVMEQQLVEAAEEAMEEVRRSEARAT